MSQRCQWAGDPVGTLRCQRKRPHSQTQLLRLWLWVGLWPSHPLPGTLRVPAQPWPPGQCYRLRHLGGSASPEKHPGAEGGAGSCDHGWGCKRPLSCLPGHTAHLLHEEGRGHLHTGGAQAGTCHIPEAKGVLRLAEPECLPVASGPPLHPVPRLAPPAPAWDWASETSWPHFISATLPRSAQTASLTQLVPKGQGGTAICSRLCPYQLITCSTYVSPNHQVGALGPHFRWRGERGLLTGWWTKGWNFSPNLALQGWLRFPFGGREALLLVSRTSIWQA